MISQVVSTLHDNVIQHIHLQEKRKNNRQDGEDCT